MRPGEIIEVNAMPEQISKLQPCDFVEWDLPYRCERCGDAGGLWWTSIQWLYEDPDTRLAAHEVQHALDGCNGRLEWVKP